MLNHTIQVRRCRQKGVGLLEVLVAVLVLAVGIMALARFQGGLTRSGSDAKARTVATNLAQEQMETLRTFNTNAEFLAIAPGSNAAVERSGTSFTTNWKVDDYIFDGTGVPLSKAPTGANPTVKQVQVNVSWTDPSNTVETISLNSFINSTLPTETGQNFTNPNSGNRKDPKVVYTPGTLPETIPVILGDGTTGESTTPKPQITKASSTNVVDFEKVTYDSSNNEVERREAFRMVTCACKLSTSAGDALTPAYFDVDKGFWVEGKETGPTKEISKTVGVSANIKQPQTCDICCRDHHDPSTATTDIYDYYDPVRHYNASGNHEHYDFSSGSFVGPVSETSEYLESCRLVRINGIWRVAQDWRQESLQVIPDDFLLLTNVDGAGTAGLDAIRGYVTAFLKAYIAKAYSISDYPKVLPAIDPPTIPVDPDYGLADFWKKLPNEEVEDDQGEDTDSVPAKNKQSLPATPTTTTLALSSRAIYIDYMDSDLIEKLHDSLDEPDFLSKVPFSEVNVTLLTNWNDTPDTGEVAVTNEAIDNSGYSRGEVSAVSDGEALVNARITRSTSGLTGSLAIDPYDKDQEADDSLRFAVGTSGGGVDPSAMTVSGSIDLNNKKTGILASGSVGITSPTTDVNCDYASLDLSYTCDLNGSDITSFEIIVTGYNYTFNNENGCGTGNSKYNDVDAIQDNKVDASVSGSPALTFSKSVSGNQTISEATTFSFVVPPDATTFTVNFTFSEDAGTVETCP